MRGRGMGAVWEHTRMPRQRAKLRAVRWHAHTRGGRGAVPRTRGGELGRRLRRLAAHPRRAGVPFSPGLPCSTPRPAMAPRQRAATRRVGQLPTRFSPPPLPSPGPHHPSITGKRPRRRLSAQRSTLPLGAISRRLAGARAPAHAGRCLRFSRPSPQVGPRARRRLVPQPSRAAPARRVTAVETAVAARDSACLAPCNPLYARAHSHAHAHAHAHAKARAHTHTPTQARTQLRRHLRRLRTTYAGYARRR